MGHQRERFNAKGRKSSRLTKRSKHSHTLDDAGQNNADPNAEIVVPKTKEQKEVDRRERLRQELLEQQAQSKLTSKKKKRLEKYIDKKLKKEERLHLFEKLAESQAKVPAILQLQPSSTLGSRKALTNEELQAKQEDKEARRAIEGRIAGKRKRTRNAYSGIGGASDSDEELEDDEREVGVAGAREGGDVDMDHGPEPGSSRASPVIVQDEESDRKQFTGPNIIDISTIGSALRKNADGTLRAPKVVKRKAKGQRTAFRGWGKDKIKGLNPEVEEQGDSDSSFDSSDSENDSSEAEEGKEKDNATDDEDSSEKDDDDPESGDSDEDKEEYEDSPEPDPSPPKRKRTGFKDWAVQQLSVAKGYIAPPPSSDATAADVSLKPLERTGPTNPKPKQKDQLREIRGPLGEDLQLPSNTFTEQLKAPTNISADKSRPVVKKYVNITRAPEIQEARLELPILAEEQPIVEAVRLNHVVVICGETGSGKTTQVPQFLYEAGFGVSGSDNPGMIGITQPRRVAAMSMASRVATELSLPSSVVSYQIRYDATTAPTTAIKFMTDGVLLRELASDFTLSKYSVIIVDEAHERSVNTDILIGVLSRVVRLREDLWKEGKEGAKPLRLIIMSATLRVSDFVENPMLFSTPPPVIRVDARQYPVTIHFSRRTHTDYVEEAVKKVSKIHSRLPPGGILVFLTGQNEITGLVRNLEKTYGKAVVDARIRKKAGRAKSNRKEDADENLPAKVTVAPAVADVELEEMELGDFQDNVIDEEDEKVFTEHDPEALDTDDEEAENEALGIKLDSSEVPMHVLPLYSILPTEQQMKVFQPPPEGTRLVVVATNVAETSLTIPGIRYVVDCGRAKERCYDAATGVQSFRVNWISKASADQRAGRAGRTGPGHCYRLFSSALFDHHFEQFARPEILQMPIEGVVLQMKAMHIDTVTNFPFPTPPDRQSLQKAEELLVHLGALEAPITLSQKGLADGHITELGKAMALFPLSPRFAKMLVSGRQHGCLPYVIAVVAALSVGDPFLHEEALTAEDGKADNEEEEELALIHGGDVKAKELNKVRRRAFFKSQELHSRLGKGQSDIFRILSVVGAYEYAGGGHTFCREHFVRPKAMEEIHKLRAQISSIVQTNFPNEDSGFHRNMNPPSSLQLKVLRQLLCSAFIDHVAVRIDVLRNNALSGNKYASCRGVPYRALGITEDVFIHPQSVVFSQAPPDYVVFQDAVRSTQTWLKNVTVINPAWLSTLGKRSLCTFSKPTKNSFGEFMVIPHFGIEGWELPAIKADLLK